MSDTKVRNRFDITADDERYSPQVMVRRFYDDGEFFRADVFVSGWRVGTYKTEKGALARAAKETVVP
jgi:hypothetical protein